MRLIVQEQVGPKLASRIDEFITHGYVQEIRQSLFDALGLVCMQVLMSGKGDLRRDERFNTLQLLNEVHGVGPGAAKELYAAGYRTLDQLRKANKLPLAQYHADMQLKSVAIFVTMITARLTDGLGIGYRDQRSRACTLSSRSSSKKSSLARTLFSQAGKVLSQRV